jgi:ubiquinone/menaquinone biosynthesis C-methylase UbiE
MDTDKEKTFFDWLYGKIGQGDIPLQMKLAYRLRAPFYRLVKKSIETYENLILSVPEHSKCLELGIGLDGLALLLGKRGMKVTAIDISEEAIKLASNRLTVEDRSNVTYLCDNAEATQFGDQSFDLIYGRWIIHHLDLEKSSNEIRRLLKVGGKAIFLEPLGTNPILSLFRKATPFWRVKGERPLTRKDIDYMTRLFKRSRFEYFHFLFFFAPLNLDQKLMKIEKRLLEKFPVLRYLCWQILIVLENSR